ncbi:MAG: hypothetical protein MUF52_16175 [Syntrophobacteraceae bacterium]|jgi:hypothetical protein|nr:hypothetical protein [Syntrophobacteraceae bacterium]
MKYGAIWLWVLGSLAWGIGGVSGAHAAYHHMGELDSARFTSVYPQLAEYQGVTLEALLEDAGSRRAGNTWMRGKSWSTEPSTPCPALGSP